MTLAEGARSRKRAFDAHLEVFGPERTSVGHQRFLAHGRVLGVGGLWYICTIANHHGVWLINHDLQTAEEIGPANTKLRCEPLYHIRLADLLQRIAKAHIHGHGEVLELCEVALERHTTTGLIVPEQLWYELRWANKTSVVKAEDKTAATIVALAELVNGMLEKHKLLIA